MLIDQMQFKFDDNLRDYFKPEFLNRFDSIIQFKPLEKDHLLKNC